MRNEEEPGETDGGATSPEPRPDTTDLSGLRFDAAGLIPAITQDAASGHVLMHAYMNAEALARTLETGFAHYYSRSRQRLWRKGEESGHVQRAREVRYDCDGDTILILVEQQGAACHTGHHSCFYRTLQPERTADVRSGFDLLARLYALLRTRKEERPEGSYTAELFGRGRGHILKKIGEEAAEVLLAAKERDRAQTVYELADLWFHTLVLMAEMEIPPDEVVSELARRQGKRKADYA